MVLPRSPKPLTEVRFLAPSPLSFVRNRKRTAYRWGVVEWSNTLVLGTSPTQVQILPPQPTFRSSVIGNTPGFEPAEIEGSTPSSEANFLTKFLTA